MPNILDAYQDGARPALFQNCCFVLCIVLFYIVLCIVCKCVLYYCHRVTTQLQLTNISIPIKKIYIAGVQPEILAHIVTSRNGKNHSC